MREILPIPMWSEGNPLYPLPADFFVKKKYTNDERRMLRVNGCRQWMYWAEQRRKTKDKQLRHEFRRRQSEAMVAGIRFFDTYYLMPDLDEAGHVLHDPLFYDLPPVESPEFHWSVIRASVLHQRVVFVAPRGGSKSFLIRKKILLQNLSCPAYSIFYITSAEDLADEYGDDMKNAYGTNERMHNDFAPEPEFGGKLLPSKGQARLGMSSFVLANRASLRCASITSRKRGKRPIEIIVDDAEYDQRNPAMSVELTGHMNYQLVRVLLPMIRRSGASILMVGTIVSPQAFLWTATQTRDIEVEGKVYKLAIDPKFDRWTRIVQTAAYSKEEAEDGSHINPHTGTNLWSCWSQMWPINEKERDALGLPDDASTLEEIEADDPAAWQAEYMARPDLGVASVFPLLNDSLHGYSLNNYDKLFEVSPSDSETQISYTRLGNDGSRVMHSTTLRDICHNFGTFVLCDTSDTESPTSDFKTAMCLAVTDQNERIVLDFWQDQCSIDEQVLQALKMAERWRSFLIAPEAIKFGVALEDRLRELVATGALNTMGIRHVPLVEGFRPPPGLPKTAKIAAMSPLFQHGLIKVPLYQRNPGFRTVDSPWCALFEQIECFRNRGGDDTGLWKDDAVDTLSMMRFVVAGLPNAPSVAAIPQPKSVTEMLMEGNSLIFQYAPKAAIFEALERRGALDIPTRTPRGKEVV